MVNGWYRCSIISDWWFVNMNFRTFHILGIIIPTDLHIFQRGSNHQTDTKYPKVAILIGT